MSNIRPIHLETNDLKANKKYVASSTAQRQNRERRAAKSKDIEVLADLYKEDINIAIWKRTLSTTFLKAVQEVISKDYLFRISMPVTPQNTFENIYESLGSNEVARLISEDVAEIVSMFCCLFELEEVGLRLTTLDRAMCPKFHVDRVPCRLVTTYSGIATDWLPDRCVDRTELGVGSQGKADANSGLYRDHRDIQHLTTGDVALLKGESWLGNEGSGLVHRSPQLANQEKRLLLTLDFI